MARKAKRVLAISDMHCGHAVGLTPPDWHYRESTALGKAQEALWAAWLGILKAAGKIDVLLVLGDAVDGKGHRSGGTEQITLNRLEQVEMAVEVVSGVKARSVVMVHGTPYHTGEDGEDLEALVAEKVGAEKIGGHEWIDVNGVVFDIKHKPAGGSQVPHGRHTAIARDRLWSQLWAEREHTPKSDIILRAHVHYHTYAGGPGWLAMTLPALQGMGSKYGVRQCSGIVDWGAVVFDISGKGDYQWHAETRALEHQRCSALHL